MNWAWRWGGCDIRHISLSAGSLVAEQGSPGAVLLNPIPGIRVSAGRAAGSASRAAPALLGSCVPSPLQRELRPLGARRETWNLNSGNQPQSEKTALGHTARRWMRRELIKMPANCKEPEARHQQRLRPAR